VKRPYNSGRFLHKKYTAGNTINVSINALTMPPTIGAAIRLMTSEPVPVPYITGNKPNMIEVEVIITG